MSDDPRDRRQGPPFQHSVIELVPAPGDVYETAARRPARPRYGLALFLFALTFLFTTTLGPVMLVLSRTDMTTTLAPWLTPKTAVQVWQNPELLHMGLLFSLTALTILFAHEMGHYVACRRYGLPSTLPYFLPVPINFGTFGAFIKIKAPISNKRQLFDVGIAGPIAGFVTLVPFLLWGIAHSQLAPIQEVVRPDDVLGPSLYVPGRCLAIQLATWLFHGRWLGPGMTLNLHPVALGAWLGLLATAINLLPLGQLDGGHILYAATGRLQRRLALPLWVLLGLMGYFWPGWLLWTFIVILIGLYHPPVYDESEPLDGKRRLLAWFALVMFVLSFIPVPLAIVSVR
ncbi:MAG TPA: site-2 protease family protein [Thermoanaerobaculia bacterium]|jgi:membrane-associated protease RseP (regulator of RpoE activity)|nr:site-2 protease family protein [Thermoanaerobaculia bacterium]